MSESENTEEAGVAAPATDGGEQVLESLEQEETDALLAVADAPLAEDPSAEDPSAEDASVEDASAAGPAESDGKDAPAPPRGLEFDAAPAAEPAEVEAEPDALGAGLASSPEFSETNANPDPGKLAARAAEAAQSLIEERELSERRQRIVQAREAALAPKPAVAEPPTRRRNQDRILIGLMVANLILMGLMVAVPGSGSEAEVHRPPAVSGGSGQAGHGDPGDPGNGESSHQAADGLEHAGSKAPDPFHAPLQEPDEILPNHEMYDAGQLQIAKGNYAKAIGLFEHYLKAHPALQAFQLQMVYSSLAYCMQRVGRRQDALNYLAKNENLRQITALPDELWGAAQRAEQDGRGVDMRRFYARFLLQQDQLGKRWASQERIAKAYMKIGDSYRLDAERGAQIGDPQPRINRTLKKPTGKKKPQQPESADGGHGAKKAGGH